MMLDEQQGQGFFIENFLDKPYTLDFDGYDHSMTPIGNGERNTLILRRDGSMQLTTEAYDPYSGYIVFSSVVIRGQWELRNLQPNQFSFYIHDPQVEVVEGTKDTKQLLEQLKQSCVHVAMNGVWYAPCPQKE